MLIHDVATGRLARSYLSVLPEETLNLVFVSTL